MPGQPGKSRIRFFDNAEQITERTHWEFDEYHLDVDEQAGIDGVVMENYASMIERAKIAEELQGENPLPDGMDGKEVRIQAYYAKNDAGKPWAWVLRPARRSPMLNAT